MDCWHNLRLWWPISVQVFSAVDIETTTGWALVLLPILSVVWGCIGLNCTPYKMEAPQTKAAFLLSQIEPKAQASRQPQKRSMRFFFFGNEHVWLVSNKNVRALDDVHVRTIPPPARLARLYNGRRRTVCSTHQPITASICRHPQAARTTKRGGSS